MIGSIFAPHLMNQPLKVCMARAYSKRSFFSSGSVDGFWFQRIIVY
jgi:hypothetical protein